LWDMVCVCVCWLLWFLRGEGGVGGGGGVADRYPERLASLTVLSRPHQPFNARSNSVDGEQRIARATPLVLFPDAPPGGRAVVPPTARSGCATLGRDRTLPPPRRPSTSRARHPQAMEAALAWYRARGAIRGRSDDQGADCCMSGASADDTSSGGAEWTRISSPRVSVRGAAVLGHFTAESAPNR